MVWVYDQMGSLLVALLMYATLVAGQFIFFPMALAGMTALTSLLVWTAVLWIVVAVVGVINRGQIVRQTLPRGMDRAGRTTQTIHLTSL